LKLFTNVYHPKGATGFFVALSLILLFNCSVLAQDGAKISGFVSNRQTGQSLPGATITLQNTQKGAATDTSGYFIITNVEPGTYTVTASFIGYRPETKFNIIIGSGGNAELYFELQPVSEQLDAVTVQPDPFDKPDETPLSTQKLSRVEIASYPGGNSDVAKVVQSLPGVSGSVGGFRNDVIIRGGAPSENVYYLDGIEIPIINHFSTQGSAGGPVGLLNVSFFEGVSLDASSFHARYNDALSGVLRFDQRNGNSRQFQSNIRVSASEAALTTEGPLFNNSDSDYSNTTFLFSVRRSYLQLLFELIDLPFLPDYWDYQFKVNHKINEYNEINFIGLGSVDDFSINVPDDLDAEQQAILDQVPIITQWSSTTGISWRKNLTGKDGYWLTSLRTTAFDNNFTRFEDNVRQTGVIQRTQSRDWNTTLRSEYNRFWSNWTLSAGAMTENSRYNANTERKSDNANFNAQLGYMRYGFFGQLTHKWLDGRLSFSAGLRADGNSFTEDGYELFRTLSPRGSISYSLDEANRWKVTGTVGRYFKLPPNTLLGFQNRSGEFVNQSSDYIRSDHFVTGLSFTPRRTTQLSLEGFFKRYGNYPVSLDDGVSLANLGGDFEVFGNEAVTGGGNGRSYGMEFSYQQKLINDFYGILAYTLYRSEFTGRDGDSFLPSLWDNRHLLTFTGGYKLNKKWEIATRLRVLGGPPYAELDKTASEETYPELIFNYSTLGNKRLGFFNVLDIRIDRKWNFDNWSLNLFLDIENVLDSEIPEPPTYGLNRDESGNVIQPRSIVEVEDTEDSAILPSLGIVIDL